MKVQWTKQANRQLADAIDYVHVDNPKAAERQEKLVLKAVENLIKFPDMGRSGRNVGTRELAIPGTPYLAVYEIRERSIRIVAVLHGAQRWPASFKH